MNTIPNETIAIAAIATPVYTIGSPVLTVKITGASSISSSPGTLLFGVESISGVPQSL